MNPVVKAQLAEFSHSNPIDGFEDQDYFEVFSIFSILNGDLNNSVIPFEVHLKGTEFGLDGVAILVQGQLCDDSNDISRNCRQKQQYRFCIFFNQNAVKNSITVILQNLLTVFVVSLMAPWMLKATN
ncbi:MAG: hypothetical protein U5K38_12920 [Woeseiaceae bacterium]|nr:hypothetical protein [Woeseiaceae bacterium]